MATHLFQRRKPSITRCDQPAGTKHQSQPVADQILDFPAIMSGPIFRLPI